jgi:hypothetical protein
MEIATKIGLDRMGEDDHEDDDDGGDAAAPPTATPSPAVAMPPIVAAPELIIMEEEEDPEEMVPNQEAPEVLEVILPKEEPEPPQPRLFTVLMRDHEESTSRMFDDLDDLDDLTHADYDVDEWFPKDGSRDHDRVLESRSYV